VLFRYTPDRKVTHPRTHLSQLTGALHADGYAGFDRLFETGRIHEIACWAHARRKFFDLFEATQSPIAKEALDRIGVIYGIVNLRRLLINPHSADPVEYSLTFGRNGRSQSPEYAPGLALSIARRGASGSTDYGPTIDAS
jgi:Transposase IS66 family